MPNLMYIYIDIYTREFFIRSSLYHNFRKSIFESLYYPIFTIFNKNNVHLLTNRCQSWSHSAACAQFDGVSARPPC